MSHIFDCRRMLLCQVFVLFITIGVLYIFIFAFWFVMLFLALCRWRNIRIWKSTAGFGIKVNGTDVHVWVERQGVWGGQ